MSYTFNNEVPIYIQIVDIITKEIISGVLKPGQKIPSVREYASIFSANPNTISKALQVLEENKLIYTERTNGKFVTNDFDVILCNKEVILNMKITNFINDIKSMGFNEEDIINKIKEIKKWA